MQRKHAARNENLVVKYTTYLCLTVVTVGMRGVLDPTVEKYFIECVVTNIAVAKMRAKTCSTRIFSASA